MNISDEYKNEYKNSCVIYSYIHISIINQRELLGLCVSLKVLKLFSKNNVSQCGKFVQQRFHGRTHPKDHVPSYLHMVYRRKFRFWSLEHITIFSLAHVYWDSRNSHWNKVLCAYLRREKEEAEGGCSVFINYLGKLISMMAIVQIFL